MDEYGVQEFDRSVDFGWFYFLTKPIFHVLEFIFGYVGNFGWAIIIFTILMRICFFPLAQQSFKSMAKMKKLTPEIQRLKEQYGCLLYTSPSPRDATLSRMPSSA